MVSYAAKKLFSVSSLRTRVTVFTLAIFLTGLWSLAFFSTRMLRDDMQRVLGDQQFSTARFVAADINDELDMRCKALELVASSITSSMLEDHTSLLQFLEQKSVMRSLFNGGVHIIDRSGVAIADVSEANRLGKDFGGYEGVQAVFRDGTTKISQPLFGPLLRSPVLPIITPILDSGGLVLGALIGTTNLARSILKVDGFERFESGGVGDRRFFFSNFLTDVLLPLLRKTASRISTQTG